MNKKNLKKATVMLAGALAIGASVAGGNKNTERFFSNKR